MKKITAFLATILSFMICLGGVSPAFAQDVSKSAPVVQAPSIPQPASRGITTFYLTPEQQAQGKTIYQQLNYDVAIPNPDFSAALPENAKDFPAVYQRVLAEGRKKNGTNGSFTEGWFDFQASTAVIPGTNTLFAIKEPFGGRIYSVVAGLPASQCPLKINSTQIAFFDKQADAEAKAAELDGKGFLVYVSPVDDLTIKAFSQLFYDPATGKKKTNKDCFLVSGATEGVKVDFQKIYPYLPPALQQPARDTVWEYFPRVGSVINLVNSRKTLTDQAGNLVIDRPSADVAKDFYLVDTNNPVNVSGNLTSWQIWAKNTLPVQLIIYRRDRAGSWSVVGKSDVKTPVVGANTFTLPTPIETQKKGDEYFVGLYYPKAGSVAYAQDSGPDNLGNGNFTGTVFQTKDGAGVNSSTNFAFSTNRTYSVFVKGPAL
ncbi:hypothetical protein ACQFX9_11040 [Aliinostoc sp. HNIBRCY26]|uniref:hypothetical protein n=1 Tax=Aliinostoc sp. HNIBRCY26 TaxID=3418997 RepID=UPI003D081EE0